MSADQAVNAAVPNRSDPRWRYSAARLAGLLSEKKLRAGIATSVADTVIPTTRPSYVARYRLLAAVAGVIDCDRYQAIAHLSRSTNVRAAAAVWGVAWGSVQIAAWASALVYS